MTCQCRQIPGPRDTIAVACSCDELDDEIEVALADAENFLERAAQKEYDRAAAELDEHLAVHFADEPTTPGTYDNSPEAVRKRADRLHKWLFVEGGR